MASVTFSSQSCVQEAVEGKRNNKLPTKQPAPPRTVLRYRGHVRLGCRSFSRSPNGTLETKAIPTYPQSCMNSAKCPSLLLSDYEQQADQTMLSTPRSPSGSKHRINSSRDGRRDASHDTALLNIDACSDPSRSAEIRAMSSSPYSILPVD